MLQKTLMLLLLVVSCYVSSAWAADKVSGSVVYRANYISPENGDGLFAHDLNAYMNLGKIGLGLDTLTLSERDYLRLRPYATIKANDRIKFVGGLSTDSNGADHMDVGVWYADRFGRFTFFADPRLFFSVSDEANDFFDLFVESLYQVNDKLSVGVNVCYDHWWESGSDWMLVGPVAYWKLTDSVTIFTRIGREMDFRGGSESTDFRLALKLSF